MDKKLPSLVLLSVLGLNAGIAQNINAQLPIPTKVLSTLSKADTSSVVRHGIRLNPANKFNTAPKDIVAQLTSGRTFAGSSFVKSPRKAKTPESIKAAESYADSLLVYGVYKEQPGESLSTKDLVQYSFHSAPAADFTAEAAGKPLPDGTVYVRVNDLYYIFSAGNVTIANATTGEVVKNDIAFKLNDEDVTPLQAATYDPATGKIYVIYWGEDYGKSILTFDPTTYDTKYLADMPGYPLSITAAPDGKLYFFAYPATLYSFDTATGENTKLFDNVKSGKSYQNGTASQSGAFDWATGYLYLANLTQDWKTHLTKIDVNKGTATDIVTFPEGQRFVGLYIPQAEADAPAAPSKISFADGKLLFTAPSQTYSSGKQLSGELTAYVTVDGGAAVEQTVTPGEAAQVALDLVDGPHAITVEIGNAAGHSTARRLNTYVGTDVPVAVSGLEFSTEDGKNATVAWQKPENSVHGGPVDDATLNYRVVRYPDEVVVAEGLKETSFKDILPDTHARYYYEVTAFAGDRAGQTATSNVVPAGDTWVPPYTETFDTQDDFDFFKVIDANGDGQTWTHLLPQVQNANGYAYLHGNGVADVDTGIYEGHGNDDYLVSPKIQLKGGADYRLKFETYDNWLTNEYMTVLVGKHDKVTGDEIVVKKFTDLHSNSQYSMLFSVPEDGDYYLMLHADNPGQSVSILLDNLGIDLYSTYNGPASSTDVKAVAGEKGALSNTLSFTAPTKTYKDAALDKIEYINVYRNGGTKPVHVFEAPQPGERLTWTDNDVEQGLVNYRIVAFSEAGQGCEALVTNWVGLDMPAKPAGVKIRMNDQNQAVLTWDKVGDKGMHGGYVNPDDVKYVLKRYNEYNFMDHWETVTDSTSEATLTDESYTAYSQTYVDYCVVAGNAAGESEGAGAGIVLGAPYERPYEESFAYGFASLDPWTLSANTYNYAWQMVTGSGLAVKPYDGDEGMLQFSLKDSDSNNQVLMGPRISLKDAENAELSFFMYHGFEAEEGDLQLDVWTNYDDEGWQKAATVDYNNGQEGWARFSLPMRKDAGNVQIAFGGYAADASASIYVDHLKIDEAVANDMAVEAIAVAKKRVEAGESTTVKVNVANYGLNNAEGYKVVLTRNGETYAEKSGEAIAQNHSGSVVFDIPTAKSDAAKTFAFRAAVVNDGDTNVANDSSSVVKLYVHGSVLPKAEALSGTAADGAVKLTWQKPSKSEIADAVTDGFDDYESFIIDGIGDWTTYDGDGTPTVYFGGPQIAHAYEAKAWQVWAPEEAGFSLAKFDVLTPHSGDKYLACWAASDGVTQTLPNDDWLISSEVTGGTDVSFYYRKPNDGSDPQVFEMLYSTTDNDPESFTAFDRDSISVSTDWQHFEYTLPAEAKYFALRSCSTGSYTVAFLDDITYTPLYGTTTPVTLLGYNVYRDDKLIAENVTSTSYTDTGVEPGSHSYYVTAVWKEGESNCSDIYEADVVTGINAAKTLGGASVEAGKGRITVSGAEGKRVEVADLAGQTVFRGVAGSTASVDVAAGVYLVKVGGKAVKVLVK